MVLSIQSSIVLKASNKLKGVKCCMMNAVMTVTV